MPAKRRPHHKRRSPAQVDEDRNERICNWAAKRLLIAETYKFCIFQIMSANRCERFAYEWFLSDAPIDILYDFMMQELKLQHKPTILFVRPRKRNEMKNDDEDMKISLVQGQTLRDLDKGVQTLTFQVTPCG